jgi:hypothetical protein
MTIEITDNGKAKQYHLKEPGTLTVADYRLLKAEPLDDALDERERLVELLKRLTGIPKTHLRRIPMAQFTAMLDTMATHVEQLGKDQAAANATDPATTFEFRGTTYTVPQDIEAQTVYGQWEDLHNVLIPQAGTSEADIAKAICAAMCLPEGVEYSGTVVKQSMQDFEALPVSTALAVSAFFFGSSKRFTSDTSRSILHSQISKLRSIAQGRKPSQNATAPTPDYTAQPS